MLQRACQVLFAIVTLMLAATAPALSAGTGYGTPAWSTAPLTLFEGPGATYDVIGTVEADLAVTVYRCTMLWCQVGDGHQRGWALLDHLDFGVSPAGQYSGPRLNYGEGGGAICLFEGPNFTGASVCAGPGRVFNDLLLYHRDNRFSSISVEGYSSATLCRDRDFQSYCERITASQPTLSRHLDNHVSSVRIY